MKTLLQILMLFAFLTAGQLVKSQSPDSLIGQVVAADPDIGQTLTYEIVSGNDNNYFYLDRNTGLLYLHKRPIGITKPKEYVLIIKVTDNGVPPMSSKATITVILTPTGKTYNI